MTNTQPKRKYVDVLKEFCGKAGVDTAKGSEPPLFYSLGAALPAGSVAAALEKYSELVDVFGQSLDLKVGILDEEREWPITYLDIKGGQTPPTISTDIKRIQELDTGKQVNVELKIHKPALTKKLELDEAKYNCFFYLFEQNLIDFLNAPLLELDEQLYLPKPHGEPDSQTLEKKSEDDSPVLIVISEADILFMGEMLTIVGESILDADPGLLATPQGRPESKTEAPVAPGIGNVDREKSKTLAGCLSLLRLQVISKTAAKTLDEAQKTSPESSGILHEEIRKYRTAALENPSLIGGQFTRLTPLHFLGHWEKENGSTLKGILARHFVNICILYTANRSTLDNEKNALLSVYNSADRTTTLSLKDPPTSEISTNAFESLAKWLNGAKGTDRRTVFQNIIARELYDDDPKISYNDFITRAPQLLKDAVWQYQVFIDGKITKHFDELQKVIGYVTEINKKISEAIDSVTKSLTDALLATVGVLVLTVLAALVKKDTSIEIFKLSMDIYSVYLVFYAAYRMGSIGHSYRLLSKEASAQVREYQSALRIEEITDLSSSLRKRRRQFHIWFWLTVVLYLVLGGSIWWAGKKGPQLLIDRGIITAPGAKKPEASSSVFGKILHEQRFTC